MSVNSRLDTKKKKKLILEQLEQNKGLVATACRAIGIPRSTYYTWIKNDEEFKERVSEVTAIQVEKVRSKLDTLIDNGNPAATIFYLKNKDPEFKPQLEIGGKDGEPIKVQSIFSEDLIKKDNG